MKPRVLQGWTAWRDETGTQWGTQIPHGDKPGKQGETVLVVSRTTKKETLAVLEHVIGRNPWGTVWATSPYPVDYPDFFPDAVVAVRTFAPGGGFL